METTVSYLTFNEVGITIAVIAVACGFIALVWNAIKAIKEWIASLRKPTDDHISDVETQVEDHENRITKLEECCEEVRGKLQNDFLFQQDNIAVNQLMLKSIKRLLQHSIDGNDTAKLREMEQEIDDYLLKHAR